MPVTISLGGRNVLVVGAGPVGLRKAKTLLEAGATVRIVAPNVDAVEVPAGARGIARNFQSDDLDGVFLVVAATNDAAVNANIVAQARARGTLCANVSDGSAGDVWFPAVVSGENLTIAIDSAGSAPAFSKRIAQDIAQLLARGYDAAASTIAAARQELRESGQLTQAAQGLRNLARLPIDALSTLEVNEAVHRATLPRLVCASRASALALIQANLVCGRLVEAGHNTEILEVTTTGDRVVDRPLSKIGSQSLFVGELESALRDGRAHFAVHSCKDLPSVLPDDMLLCAITVREDPRDVFCSEQYESFDALPSGARVGTSSSRRRAQLAAIRSDLQYVDLRGNVDTRLRKLREGQYDAIVLAMAGLLRLGARATHMTPFDPDTLIPATAQGALAIETKAGYPLAEELRAILNDAVAERAIIAERSALAELRAGCQAPVGVHASWAQDITMILRGIVASEDGSKVVRSRLSATVTSLEEACAAGRRLAEQLRAAGAHLILAPLQQGADPVAKTAGRS